MVSTPAHTFTTQEENMPRGLNKVMIIGNLGADPEIRETPNGSKVANLRIATTDTWTDKSGTRQERTEWHRVVMFNRLAEIAGEYLAKGSKVYVEGRLQTRQWTDKEGVERYTTEITALELQMLDRRDQKEQRRSTPDFDDNVPF